MGRDKRKPAWEHYNYEDKKEPHPRVECKYCSKEYKRGVPERMQNHLDRCKKAPKNAKSSCDNDGMSKNEQNSLEVSLVKALSSAKVDPSFVEDQNVIEFFKKLRPSFTLPNREKVNKLELSIGRHQNTDTCPYTQTEYNPNHQTQTHQTQQTESSPYHQTQIQQTDSNPNHQTQTQQTESNPNHQTQTQQTESNPNHQTQTQQTESNPNYHSHYSYSHIPTQSNDYFEWLLYNIQ
ncbi:hypothetical protein GLOIN_2v1786327 [Rhizophagus clarus]|uniref:BED-type domain-containing protein n=1 Tax=Rhizophagus clarus TaxID=94130 RepID=A0A8H3MI67_9GLOM|nr:hypothetical protein GLOIN_2v1786327 [Rhizophagus clarus]